MSDNNSEIYNGQVHPDTQKIIDSLTINKNWSYLDFKKVLVALAKTQQYVPARNRPESIHLQGLRQYIEDLKLKSQNKLEFARAIFVDTSSSLTEPKFMLGKTTRGTDSSVRLDWEKPPNKQAAVRGLSIHVPPAGYQGWCWQWL